MTVTCGTCARYTLGAHPDTHDDKSARAATAMAKQGLGRCLVGAHYRFLTPTNQRSCARHTPGTPQQ
jgi:hypothetical protein